MLAISKLVGIQLVQGTGYIQVEIHVQLKILLLIQLTYRIGVYLRWDYHGIVLIKINVIWDCVHCVEFIRYVCYVLSTVLYGLRYQGDHHML